MQGARRGAKLYAAGVLVACAAIAGDGLPSQRETWRIATTPSFVVVGAVPEKKLAEIAEGLERFRFTLLRLKPEANPVAPARTLVVAFKNDRAFDPYKRSHEPGRMNFVGMFGRGRYADFIAVNAYPNAGSGTGNVYAGYAGTFISTNYPSTPLWLHDGMAHVYSTFRWDGKEAQVGRAIPESVSLLRRSPLLSLSRILAMSQESAEYRSTDSRPMFDAQAWIMAHYLVFGPQGGATAASGFLRKLDAGEELSNAFAASFGETLDRFEGRLRSYASQPAFPFLRLSISDMPPPAVSPPRTLRYAETLYYLGELALQLGEFELARDHLDAALGLEPQNGDALAMRALIAERLGDRAGAGELYDRMERGLPQRPESWLFRGHFRLSSDPVRPSREACGQALGDADRALCLAPEHAEAAALKGWAALCLEEYGTAIAALAEAERALPDRVDIVLNRFSAHLGAGQLIQARALLQGRLRRLADPTRLAAARAQLAEHEAYDAAERARREMERALASNDWEGALAALAAGREKAASPEARARYDDQIAELERARQRYREVEAYNRAVAALDAGRVAEARQELAQLLADCHDGELCAAARELQANLDRRKKRR